MAVQSLVPCRFLSLMAHLIITIMLFWSRERNVLACVTTPGVTAGSVLYNAKDIQLIVGLSLSLGCIVIELTGLVVGLSMFSSLTNLFSIGLHVSASIVLSFFVIDSWSCDLYWYVFSFCCFLPFVIEIGVIIYTLRCKVFR